MGFVNMVVRHGFACCVMSLVTAACLLGAPASAFAMGNNMLDHLVNGDFEYPEGMLTMTDTPMYTGTYTNGWKQGKVVPPRVQIIAETNQIANFNSYYYDIHSITLNYPLFNKDKFGWESNEKNGTNGGYQYNCFSWYKGNVELVREPNGNQYLEATPYEGGTYSFQTISVQPYSLMHWSLDHCGGRESDRGSVDRMQVYVGNASNLKSYPSRARRTSSNGASYTDAFIGTRYDDDENQIGYIANYVETLVPKSRIGDTNTYRNYYEREGDWQGYEGWAKLGNVDKVSIGFESIQCGTNVGASRGNYIDNITFEAYYPLVYDANGGAGVVPLTGFDGTFDYLNYYPAGKQVDLASTSEAAELQLLEGQQSVFEGATKDSRSYSFVGWSESAAEWATSAEDVEAANIIDTCTIAADQPTTEGGSGANTVYAVYARDPQVTLRDGKTGAILETATVAYGTSVDDFEVPEKAGYAFAGFEGGVTTITEDMVLTTSYTPLDLKLKVPVTLAFTADADGALSPVGTYVIENECDVALCVSAVRLQPAESVTYKRVSAVHAPDEVGVCFAPGAGGTLLELSDCVGADGLTLTDNAWKVDPGGVLALSGLAGRIGGFSALDATAVNKVGVLHWTFSLVE